MATTRFGVIGLGTHGTRYANHLAAGDADGCSLAAVCRRNKAEGGAYAKEHGCRYFGSSEKLLASKDVDAVVIATPPDQHAAIAAAAAGAGKHVLVEKPMARTVGECQEIIDACDEAGVKLMVGQTFRYNALVMEMRKLASELGSVVHVTLCQRQGPTDAAWHHDKDAAGGGNLIENGVHLIDAARWITGQEVRTAYCELSHLAGETTEDLFVAILDMADGSRCTIDACKFTESRFGEIQIVGQAGQLIGSPSCNTLSRVVGRDVETIDPPDPIMGLPCALADFAKAITEDTEPVITGQDGLAAVAVAEACYRSTHARRPVDISC